MQNDVINDNYTNSDILNIFYIHGECNKIVERTCRIFNDRYPHLPKMNKTKFRRIESQFLQFGIAVKKTYPKPVTEDENKEVNVLAYFHANGDTSIPAASRDLGISVASVHRILQKHKFHPYSYTTLQAFREGDNIRRTNYCEFMLVKLQEDPNFLSKIIWTDESKFTREGIVNRRNLHFWSQHNPHLIRNHHYQDRFGFNVFALIMDDKVRYEIYEENLNSQKYIDILTGTVSTFLDELPLQTLRQCWYQLDGAGAHTSREVYQQLTNMFEDRWIGNNGPWQWPPRAPDLTPLDFYLWGHIKNEVYSHPVDTKEDLEIRVRRCFTELDPGIIRKASVGEVEKRIVQCLNNNGRHIEHL